MKNILVLILVLCSSIAIGWAQEQTTLTRFEGQRITKLDVSGAWKIELTQGDATKAVFSFPKRFEKQLNVSLDGGKLKIAFEGKVNAKSTEKFSVQIVCSSLAEIELGGACKLQGLGIFKSNNLEIDLTGVASVQFPGELWVADKLKIDNSGAAKLSAHVTTQYADLELSGAATLTLSGTVESGSVKVSGAAKVEMENVEARKLNIDVSGAGKANLNVSEEINGEITGVGKVIYKGNAHTRIDVSGAGSLKHN